MCTHILPLSSREAHEPSQDSAHTKVVKGWAFSSAGEVLAEKAWDG